MIFNLTSMQQHDTGYGPEFGGRGWDITVSATNLMDMSPQYWQLTPNGKPLLQSLVQATMEKHSRFTNAQWRHAEGHDGINMPSPDYVLGTDGGEAKERNTCEWFLNRLLETKSFSVDEPVVNDA